MANDIVRKKALFSDLPISALFLVRIIRQHFL